MPFLLAEILNFQGLTHHIGVGSFSYLHNTAALKQGGYYSYSSTAIDTLPFIYDPKKAIDVERLVINILQLKSKQEDSHDLEKGIDQIFYDMYGFSEQEQKVVRQYLEM